MTTGATGQLGLALPVQGELSGSWGNTVNNGITEYTNIAIAATLTLTNDGAVTLANTTGDASASNIVSSLTGAGTVTAQFAIVKVTGTLTTAKVVTGPSYSKTYVVDNAATGDVVTFKASGQTGVSVAVGEKCTVYFNGTDYVKVASSTADGVTTFSAGTTGLTPSTATSGAVTLAGTLANTNGGTGATAAFTQYGITYASSTTVLATTAAGTSTTVLHGNASGAPTFGAVSLTADVSGALPTANGGTNLTSFTSGGVVYASSSSALATGSAFQYDGTSILNTQAAGNNQTALIIIRNSTSGTAAGSAMYWGNDASLFNSIITKFSSAHTSKPSYFEINNTENAPITFAVNNTEKARFTSSGGFVVGTTTDPGAGIIADANGNVRTIPQSGSAKTTSYTLATTDIGEYIQVGSGGSIVVPDATFSTGDAVVIFNNTSGSITITCSITTAYIGGQDSDRATVTLLTRGVCNVLFISGTVCVITGNVTT
jgi:hypothetical protein